MRDGAADSFQRARSPDRGRRLPEQSRSCCGENISAQASKLMQRGAANGVGDGLRMARAVGCRDQRAHGFLRSPVVARRIHNDQVWPYPQCDELGVAGIVINAKGERFVDEGRGGVFVANAIARLDDPLTACAVFDEQVWQGPGKNARIPANPLLVEAGGTVHSAPTLAALAKIIGVPADRLEHTVSEYNKAYAAGTLAELNPTRSSKPIPGNAPIPTMPVSTPPFYAVPLCAGITMTMGGIAIDAHARVLQRVGRADSGALRCGFLHRRPRRPWRRALSRRPDQGRGVRIARGGACCAG